MTHSEPSDRTATWTRLICAILFGATLLNYANRVTVTQNSREIIASFATDPAGYGKAESRFGLGFAAGGLLFGILADWISIRWLYPLLVVAWSLCGMASGFAESLETFGASRFLLGLFEAGHWPCALRMTQRTFLPGQRTWGNGILQSGASAAQVLVPPLLILLNRWDSTGWRWSCWLTGGCAFPWVIAWLWSVRESDVRRPVFQTDEQSAGAGAPQVLDEMPLWKVFASRRWWLLLLTVVSINVPWHYIRVWMPDTLRVDHGYEKEFVNYFSSAYYVATFFGSVSAGWIIHRLVGLGWNVHRSRMAVFFGFSLLVACSIPAAFLSRGTTLLGLLLLTGVGSLGVAPIYYSLNQELSGRNQGKVGGSLSFLLWSILAMMQQEVGKLVTADPGIRPYLFAAVGILPLVACGALAAGWGKRNS